MLIYANDYEDQLPRAGGRDSVWGSRVNWDAPDRYSAYGLDNRGRGGNVTISSSLYLLTKYAEVTPKSFVCPYDYGTTEFNLYDYPNANAQELIDAWDFGPSPARHCSYSYHIPYGLYALNTSCEPGMAVAADRNPWIDSPAGKAKDFALFKPDTPPWSGTIKQAKHGNARAHAGDGQNVLFLDSHVEFATRAYCGVEDDNIYTHCPQGLGHPELGEPPVPFTNRPGHKKDSFLLHDPPARAGK